MLGFSRTSSILQDPNALFDALPSLLLCIRLASGDKKPCRPGEKRKWRARKTVGVGLNTLGKDIEHGSGTDPSAHPCSALSYKGDLREINGPQVLTSILLYVFNGLSGSF